MAQKKNYSRYFIILEEDEKGYSLGVDKSASGYVKIENKNGKCKISYYVQNIKKQSTPYYMVLICNKKGSKDVIKIGEMNIDEYGRADICYEYPTDNIANSNINIDKASGAAIVKFIDSNIISVMSGFSTTEIPRWKSFNLIEDNDKKEETIKEHKENKTIFDKYEETIEQIKVKDKKEEGNIKEQAKSENIKMEEHLDTESKTINIEANEERKMPEIKQNENRQDDKNRKLKDYPIGLEGKYFKNLVNELEFADNISDEIKNCVWYKIKANNEDDMRDTCNYDKFMVLYNPMLKYYSYIEKYGHYILGYKCDESGNMKYLVYGIPGDKTREEQPFKGKSGFVTWIQNKEDNLGYWLMFYDYKTNTILIPVK